VSSKSAGDVPSAGTLYLVSTPIGHLGDMTIRAIETLRTCDAVVAEDTRRTRQLLTHFAIPVRCPERLDAHATGKDVARWVQRLGAGESVALVTDAGTPTVSDPGQALIEAAIEAGARVVPVPGASAVLAALVGSGLAEGGAFRFLGFLPRAGAERRDALALVAATQEPVVLFEAANRLHKTLRDLADATPNRRGCVARELTKLHEEHVRGTCAELAADDREWRGEAAIVLGTHRPDERTTHIDDAALDARIDSELANGEHARTIAERLAAWSGRTKRQIYERVIQRKAARS
jgi:16S rRNA (cytidine1402-2'-O)-methyltransferase